MEKDEYLARMRYGFEFETMVEFLDPIENQILVHMIEEPDGEDAKALEKYIHKTVGNALIKSKGKKKKSKPEYNVLTANLQVILASILNENSPVPFQVVLNNSDNTLSVSFVPKFPEDPSYEEDANAWSVTSDMSVHLNESDKAYQVYEPKGRAIRQPNPERTINYIEIVSGILSKRDDDKVAATFNHLPCPVKDVPRFAYWHNQSTSCHVHISCGQEFRDPKNLLRICTAWWLFEPCLSLFVAPWRLENRYCRLMRSIIPNLENAISEYIYFDKTLANIIGIFQERNRPRAESRYAALNLTQLFPGGYGTVEVRLKQGSTSSEETLKWAHLLERFFASAISVWPAAYRSFTEKDNLKFKTASIPKDKKATSQWDDLRDIMDIFFSKMIDNKELENYWRNVAYKIRPELKLSGSASASKPTQTHGPRGRS